MRTMGVKGLTLFHLKSYLQVNEELLELIKASESNTSPLDWTNKLDRSVGVINHEPSSLLRLRSRRYSSWNPLVWDLLVLAEEGIHFDGSTGTPLARRRRNGGLGHQRLRARR